MALTYSTLTLDTFAPDGVTRINGTWRLRINTVGEVLKDVDGGSVLAGRQRFTTTNGRVVFSLPNIPQAGILPADASYSLTFESRDKSVKLSSEDFQVSGPMTLDDIMSTSGVPMTSSLVAQAETARDEAVAAAVAAAAVGTTNGVEAQGLDRAALATADTSAVAGGLPVVLPAGTYNVASNLTVAAPVHFHPGAKIKPASGVTVTLSGGVTAGTTQTVFDHSAAGVVLPRNVDTWHPGWWGPVNTANDTATWTAMATAVTAHVAATTNGVRVRAPKGVNRIFGVTLTHVDLDCGGIFQSTFAPVAGSASGTMLTTGTLSTIRGGFWKSDGIAGITLLKLNGTRSYYDGLLVEPKGAGTIGIHALRPSGSITPRILNTVVYSGDGTGTGIRVESSDAELTNVWVGLCNVGIESLLSATMFSSVHVWGCTTTGIVAADACQFTTVYSETNGGWGIDATGADGCTFTNVRLWSNGASVAGTGGIKFSTVGSGGAVNCRNNSLTNIVLDDNVGTGLEVEGTVAELVGDVLVDSTVVKGGGAAVTTTGVNVGASAFNVDLRVRGTSGNATTQVANASPSTRLDLGTQRKAMTTAVTATNSTAYSLLLSMPVGANQKWLVRGWVIVDSSQVADAKLRLQATSATGATGYFGADISPSGSNTSTSAANTNPSNAVTVAATGGLGYAFGALGVGVLQKVAFEGYVSTASAAGTLDLHAGPNVADATTTTFSFATMEAVRVL